MTNEEVAEVVAAEIEGKQIEKRERGTEQKWWKKKYKGYWDFKNWEYRVIGSPARPREVFALERDDGSVCELCDSRTAAQEAMNVNKNARRIVCFRELTEGE